MANIRIDLDHELLHGEELVFKAPCDCTAVSGIKVYYPSTSGTVSKTLIFKDAHGNVLTDINNLFSSGVLIKVLVDSTDGYAYILNADTNAYLEAKTTPVDNLESERADLSLSARMGNKISKDLQWYVEKGFLPQAFSPIATALVEKLSGYNGSNVKVSDSGYYEKLYGWYAFDQTTGSPYISLRAYNPTVGAASCWLKVEFTTPKFVEYLTGEFYCGKGYPMTVKVQASDDDIIYEDISSEHTFSDTTIEPKTRKVFCNKNNYKAKKYYKIIISATGPIGVQNSHSGYIENVQLYGY